jgi:hypothetical protein
MPSPKLACPIKFCKLEKSLYTSKRANAWLGVSLLAPVDSLESKPFFAYKVESFLFFLYKFFVVMKNNQTKKIVT